MKILIEKNISSNCTIGRVFTVEREVNGVYIVRNMDEKYEPVKQEYASVLIEPHEALRLLGEGKKIEVWGEYSRLWIPVTVNTYFSTKSHYRLKPEPPKPKYEPFTMDDWQEFAKMPVRSKTGNRFYFVASFNETNVTLSNTYTYAEALEAFEFIDGRPFGKEVKQ